MKMMKKSGYKIYTLGCKVNQSESDQLASMLMRAGIPPAADDDAVSLCVINTCAVTGKAAAQSRQAVRRLRRSHPDATTVVVGCDARIEPQAFERIAGVDAVNGSLGARELARIVNIGSGNGRLTDKATAETFQPISLSSQRTRPFLKVQDGCDAHCSYCIVPRARGGSRSIPLEAVLGRLAAFESAGFREVVLTGIHLGAYGRDFNPPLSLEGLVRHILDADFKLRLRLSSIEPAEISDEIITLVAGSDNLCRHFHIPLQSGDNTILKKMCRPYDRQTFARVIERLAARIPDCAIGVDVLVGFPGETEAAFARTYDLIASLPVTYLHVFPFSPRPGTPAAKFPGRIAPEVLKQRCARMRRLGRDKRGAFYRRFVGQQVQVLVEGTRDRASGGLKGVSDHYLSVHFDGIDDLMNRMVRVTVERLGRDGNLQGQVQK